MTATSLIHGQPLRRVRAGEYQVTIGDRHYRIAGSPLAHQWTVTVDGEDGPVITGPGDAPFRTITAAARALEAHTGAVGPNALDVRFALLREQARDLRCDLWADWIGSTVAGYVFTCAFIGCQTDTRQTRHDTPEAALTAARDHGNQHQQQARQPAQPPAPAGMDVPGIAARARVYAEERRAAVASHPQTADDADRASSAAASAAVSVAVGNVFPPLDGPAYTAVLGLVSRLRRDQFDGGATEARTQLEHHDYPPQVRAAHAARVQALADVLDQCGIDMLDSGRVVRELRAFAATFTPTTATVRAVATEGGSTGAAPA